MKILITGADGLLGSNLCTMYSKEHEVYATDVVSPSIPRCLNYKLDILDKEDLKIIEEKRPDILVHCAALVDVDYCEQHPEEAEKTNSLGTKNIAEAARKSRSYLVHISTDAIFDGIAGDYREESCPNPLNTYGKTKLNAEHNVQQMGTDYIIIRTNIYGWNRKDKYSLAEWMLSKLEKLEKLPAFRDIYFSPILVNNLGEAILELHNLRYKGILHIAGSESCSKLDFAKTLARIFNLDHRLIEPISIDDLNWRAKRAKKMTLNTERARCLLKTKLLNIKGGLKEFKELRDKGFIKKLREKRDKIIAIIPALNEEENIENVLKNIKDYVDEIIVIDDCSKDNTAKISERYAIIIKHTKRMGYDRCLNDGFKVAKKRKADMILTLDADGQHLAEEIVKFTKPLIKQEADICVGRRPYKARFMEYIFANYGRKRGINDPLCGMKAYRTKVYEDIGFFDNISSVGTQLLFLALKNGYNVKEIPIKLNKRKDNPRYGGKLKANIKLLAAYLRLKRYFNKTQLAPIKNED